jgi:hypothetical protein
MAISGFLVYLIQKNTLNGFHYIRRRVGTFFQATIGRPTNLSTPLLLLFIDEKSHVHSSK